MKNNREKTDNCKGNWWTLCASMLLIPAYGMAQTADTLHRSVDEVVVQVAYGAAKKSTLTGAVSQIDSRQIDIRPLTSVTGALEGTMPGVQVNNTYGQPGSEPTIRVRGFGTVNGVTDPLYVLDGAVYNGDINDLNPNDIESISVLKDAASCALYGNRASNGVILITTKRGRTPKMSLQLTVNQGSYSRGMKDYKRLNANQFMEVSWQNVRNAKFQALKKSYTDAKTGTLKKGIEEISAEANDYANTQLIASTLKLNIYNKEDNQLFDPNSYGRLATDATILPSYADDLDWYDQALRHGYRQEYNVSGSQATDRSDSYFSLGYLDEQGYVRNADFNRLNGRVAMNFRPRTWIQTGFALQGTHQQADITNGTATNSADNAFRFCRDIAPIYPVHLHNADGSYRQSATGELLYDTGKYTDSEGNLVDTRNQWLDRNVVWENSINKNNTRRNALTGSAYATFRFLDDFSFTVKGDMNWNDQRNRTYDSEQVGNGVGSNGRTQHTTLQNKTYTVQQQLNWSRRFGLHAVSALLGHENYSFHQDYEYILKSNQKEPNSDNLSNFNTINTVNGYTNDYRTESYLGRVRYSYDDKYNVEASFRRDGSSRFAKDNRWGNFSSIGASWVVTREKFMKDASWVDFLKLRADYGQVGNDASASYYSYMSLYYIGQNGEEAALLRTQLGNADLKWETGESFGIGLDARLFNRWNVSVEYFDKRNKDLLFDVYFPLSGGSAETLTPTGSRQENIGSIANRGFEINTDVDIYRNADWTVNLAANATFIKNKVTRLPEGNKEGIIKDLYNVTEGKSLYEFYTYTFEGVDQLTGQSLYKADLEKYHVTAADKSVIGNEEGADISSVATLINGQYYVNNTTYSYKEFQGSALPKVYGSFTPSVRYKDLTLSAMFTYAIGGKVYDAVYQSLMSTAATPQNYHEDILKAWTQAPEGMTADSPDRILRDGIPEINSTNSPYNNANSSRWLTNASYLTLKNLTMTYTLPRQWTRMASMESVRLRLTCENLFTCTKRQGMNPQQSFDGSQANYLVTPRVFTFGIDVKF